MDLHFLEREKELFKINAKLNAKTKKVQVVVSTKAMQAKPVQIHTANNNFNYYEESLCHPQKELQEDGIELLCKKINISNQPVKKPHEIVYPLFSRQNKFRRTNLDIHMPGNSMVSDGKADQGDIDGITDFKLETAENKSFKSESMLTRCSEDSSAVPPAIKSSNFALSTPSPSVESIPKSMEKKNISNDGILKFLKSKVALLQTEVEASKSLNDTIEKENVKHLKKIKKFSVQNEKLITKIGLLESELKTLQEKHIETEQALKAKDTALTNLNEEMTVIRQELKETNNNRQLTEKRLLKTQEDFEMVQSKFETFKDIEIILKESAKQEKEIYEEKIRKLRKGRMELLKTYKQQLIIIDNLRRQNVCLEKTKTLEIAEKEFLKVLDWNFV